MERRRFNEEYKRNAVNMTRTGGRSRAAVARELGIDKQLLYRWCRAEAEAKPGGKAFPGNGRTRDQEMAELQRRLRQAEMERDILKKATAFFAQNVR